MPRFVFVVTYGRSGSTLTQGLLNTLPGVLVRGENSLFVLPLFRAWDSVMAFQDLHAAAARSKGVRSAFYGLDQVDPDDFVRASRDLMVRSLQGADESAEPSVLGFKEVLWHRVRVKETPRFFDFFEQVFPEARYVLHRRRHEDVSASGFWRREEATDVEKALRRVEKIQDYLRQTRPERTCDTHYEHMISDDREVVDRQLRDLADFVVSEVTDDVIRRMHETLGIGHGPNPRKGAAENASG